MYLIACVDDRMGMMFNHRRVSRDRTVIRDIMDRCGDQGVYIESGSAVLFKDFNSESVHVWNEDRNDLLEGHYFFAEDPDVIREESVEKIILYQWNRNYPADKYFPIDLDGWILEETDEFAGYSHEKITRSCFVRDKVNNKV